jgi:hypothetical protein
MATEYDPYAEVPAPEGLDPQQADYDEYLKALGWEPTFTIGTPNSPLKLNSWRRYRNGASEWMIELEDAGEGSPIVHTDSLVEYLDLLARWAPIVQTAAVTHLLAELGDNDLGPYNTVGRVAAKVLTAEDRVLPFLRRNQ